MKSTRVSLLILALLGLATALASAEGTWVDYDTVWAPAPSAILHQSVTMDPGRFGEALSEPWTAPLYKMYYNGDIIADGEAGWEIRLATSPDGLSWTDEGPIGKVGRQPVVVYSATGFGSGDAKYRMWFGVAADEAQRHQTGSLRMCESSNGVTWGESVGCSDADPARPLLVSQDGYDAWNRGSYGFLRIFYNPAGPDAVDLTAPMANRYAGYYSVYGKDPVWQAESGIETGQSVAMAVSANGIDWQRVGDTPIIRGVENIAGGFVSFMDVVETGNGYTASILNEDSPAEGYNRRVAQAQSADGVTWTVVDQDIQVLRVSDPNKGLYGLTMAADPMTGEPQVWLSAREGENQPTLEYGRLEE